MRRLCRVCRGEPVEQGKPLHWLGTMPHPFPLLPRCRDQLPLTLPPARSAVHHSLWCGERTVNQTVVTSVCSAGLAGLLLGQSLTVPVLDHGSSPWAPHDTHTNTGGRAAGGYRHRGGESRSCQLEGGGLLLRYHVILPAPAPLPSCSVYVNG